MTSQEKDDNMNVIKGNYPKDKIKNVKKVAEEIKKRGW